MLSTFTGKVIELKKSPSMGLVIIKGLFLSLVRSNSPSEGKGFERAIVGLKDLRPDLEKLALFRKICQYSPDSSLVQACYIQTLFVGLLGKYITSGVFPVKPMGLIHTFQEIKQFRAIDETETLDLLCGLKQTRNAAKGIELDFELQGICNNQMVWQGHSTFLLKTGRLSEKKGKPQKADTFLPVHETFDVPGGTGWLYAKASGDYNPHHISPLFARMFGFRTFIAHGMWSMARVLASIEKVVPFKYPVKMDTSFKLPVFMPARVSLGYDWIGQTDKPGRELIFELRDAQKGLPHIKGRFKHSL